MARRPPAADTAFGPMLIAAVEQTYPCEQRLIHDHLAARFLPFINRLTLRACRSHLLRDGFINRSNRRSPGVWGGVLCRKRYADDAVTVAIDDGLGQVVILGAGLDTRAYRLVAPRGIAAFEVDLPDNIAYKRHRLERLYGCVPAGVALVPVDFETGDLGHALGKRGFRLGRPAMFVWEAVTQYLTEHAVRRTLMSLSRAAPGSRLVFTYVRQDFLSGARLDGAQNLFEDFVTRRRLWRFGMVPEQVAPMLREYGWHEREQLGRAEFTRRYLDHVRRTVLLKDIERMVFAEKG